MPVCSGSGAVQCINATDRKVHPVNRSRTANWAALMAGTAALSIVLTACGGDSSDDDNSNAAASESPSASESAPAADFTNDKCAGSETSADSFRVGGILPL